MNSCGPLNRWFIMVNKPCLSLQSENAIHMLEFADIFRLRVIV
jgi:hypothetical protein